MARIRGLYPTVSSGVAALDGSFAAPAEVDQFRDAVGELKR